MHTALNVLPFRVTAELFGRVLSGTICALAPDARALRRTGSKHHPPPRKPGTEWGACSVALIRAGPVGPPANYRTMVPISC
ncbi:hypothetical protein [Kamptonema formosum]|uniref:hypothetical protein n=1 Tax=Kamptonema formosum TaxID=331992 RepID=UPI0012DD09F1|nr:hypothetical protein [Oscillatoria sp. PCC 10802]